MDTQPESQAPVTSLPTEHGAKPQASPLIRFIRIFLLVLIVIGIGLLCTINLWVPRLVSAILGPQASMTTSIGTTTPESVQHGSISTSTTTQSSTTQAAAYVDQSSLSTGSANPTFTGTASGVSTIYIIIHSLQPGDAPQYGIAKVPVLNGKWSLVVSASTTPGTPWVNGGLPAGKYLMQIWSSPDLSHFSEIENSDTSFTVVDH